MTSSMSWASHTQSISQRNRRLGAMADYANFVAMTRNDAKAYLDVFLSEMGPSLERFATSVDCELTYAPESLEQIWDVLRPKLAWRSGYTPPALGQPGSRVHV